MIEPLSNSVRVMEQCNRISENGTLLYYIAQTIFTFFVFN